MRAMILAAGLGTRLKPWTTEHPKALVPVGGVPMLERVILKLKSHGFREIVVNVHHFADQIVSFLDDRDFGVDIHISDESGKLLDTGGGLIHAARWFCGESVLVHNVDILSNADLGELMHCHRDSGNDVTLLTSGRESSRRLLFDIDGRLAGWHNLSTDEYRPDMAASVDGAAEEAFSGIYVVSPEGVGALCEYGKKIGKDAFPIMEFFLSSMDKIKIRRKFSADLKLLDIGKPETLGQAAAFMGVDSHKGGFCCC